MSEAAATTTDPRWGQANRDRKAEAILRTVELMTPNSSVRGGTWLDIGCGSGGIAATLAQHVERVVGVDPESWKRWEPFRATYANLQLLQGTYRDLDALCGPGSIDVVVCNQVYEHVDDPVALLAAIHRVLKPGGICYFAGPNLLWPIEPHVFWPFVHWLPRQFAQRLMRVLGSKHAHELDAWSWSFWKLTRAFGRTGFSHANAIPARLQAQFATRDSRQLMLAVHILGYPITVLNPMAPGFIFILTKSAAQ